MGLLDTFSRRKRLAAGGSADVYHYDKMSEKLRVQLVQILQAAMGDHTDSTYQFSARDMYELLVNAIRREQGTFCLVERARNVQEELFNWLLREQEIDKLLDGVELAFRVVDNIYGQNSHLTKSFVKQSPQDAIEEFNARCLEDGFGYQFVDGNIVEVNSTVIHKEVVIPALELTHVKQFASANQEYHAAHKAFRDGEYETCITECGKSFESTLKIIGKARGWDYRETDPASKLLDAAYKAEFIPQYMQAEFTALRSVLESGVPTVRNKTAAHGAGNVARAVPKHLAAFQLHQTAAAIVFLIENHQNIEKQ